MRPARGQRLHTLRGAPLCAQAASATAVNDAAGGWAGQSGRRTAFPVFFLRLLRDADRPRRVTGASLAAAQADSPAAP
jgi:hypothetical protein